PSDGLPAQPNGLHIPFVTNISVWDPEGNIVELKGSGTGIITSDGAGGWYIAVGINLVQDGTEQPDGSLFPYDMGGFYSSVPAHIDANGHARFTLTSSKNVTITGDGNLDSSGYTGVLDLEGTVPGIGTPLQGAGLFGQN